MELLQKQLEHQQQQLLLLQQHENHVRKSNGLQHLLLRILFEQVQLTSLINKTSSATVSILLTKIQPLKLTYPMAVLLFEISHYHRPILLKSKSHSSQNQVFQQHLFKVHPMILAKTNFQPNKSLVFLLKYLVQATIKLHTM